MKTTFFVATFFALGCGGALDGGSISRGGAGGADSGTGADGAGADGGMDTGADSGTGATFSGGAGGTGASPSSACGPNVSDEACQRLSACGTRPAGAPSGERLNYAFVDLVTVTDEQMLEHCRSYCAVSGRCGGTDPSACEESCPEVVQQAREQACEVTLLDALECIEKEVCRSGFPTPDSDLYGAHPCDFRTRLVDCNLVPERGAPEAFAYFGAGGGAQYVAGRGGGFSEKSCVLSMGDGMDWYETSVRCDESSGGLCCTCSAGGRPVRRTAMLAQRDCTSESDVEQFFEACGWRF